jgi:hypothetical protein
VTARRGEERKALLEGQAVDRTAISSRLTVKGTELAEEIAKGSRTGKPGDGPAAKGLRLQEADIRQELADFNTAARAELADFDAETEKMRTGAVQMATDARNQGATQLEDKLHQIEVMPPEQLAAAYGGKYKQPDGFLARYNALDEIINQPDPNAGWFGSSRQQVAWGCRLVMMIVGLSSLFVKFVMYSAAVKAYFSLVAQAFGKNEDARRTLRAMASSGDKDAVRIVARFAVAGDDESKQVLEEAGFSGDLKSAAQSEDVAAHHRAVNDLRVALVLAIISYEEWFRTLCMKPFEGKDHRTLSRPWLNKRAQERWNRDVVSAMRALNNAESDLQARGISLVAWDEKLFGADPRESTARLWELSDEDLVQNYGWKNPEAAPAAP